MFFMELTSFFSSRQRSSSLDTCFKCAPESDLGNRLKVSEKINLSRCHEPLSHAPSPSCRQLLNGSVGPEQSWMEACGTAEVWSAKHTHTLRGPLQAQRHHPDTHQARNTLRGCRLLVCSMAFFILWSFWEGRLTGRIWEWAGGILGEGASGSGIKTEFHPTL